jgi:hypothetical protein
MNTHQPTLIPLYHLPEPHHNTSRKGTYLLLRISNRWAGVSPRSRRRRPVEDLGSPLAQFDHLRGVLGDKTLLAIWARRNIEIHYSKEEG